MTVYDEYWNKFLEDGKIESYLDYKQHLKAQDNLNDRTSSPYDRWTDNQGTTNR